MSTRVSGAAPNTGTAKPRGTRARTRTAPKGTATAGLSFATLDDTALTEERFPLFEVDGTEYSMPAVVPPGYAISLNTMVRRIDDPLDQGLFLIRQLAGADALTALLASDAAPEAWRKVIDLIWPRVFGQLEGLRSGN